MAAASGSRASSPLQGAAGKFLSGVPQSGVQFATLRRAPFDNNRKKNERGRRSSSVAGDCQRRDEDGEAAN
jgi:hypothetical protein